MSRTNELGQPIGPAVPGWEPRPAPSRVPLEGRYVRLEPVSAGHVPALYASLCRDEDESLWTYRHDHRPTDGAELAARVEEWATRTPEVTWAIVPAGERAQGVATLCRIDPAHGSAEVGAVLYARSLQRTRAATEAIHLFAAYLFDGLGYRRFEWKLDALNAPSAAAARRLGFQYEGRFRNALVYKGRNRDTDWFAMTDDDWPAVRAAHRRWLDPANFDDHGRQRIALSDLTSQDG